MELLFATIIGAGFGGIIRYSLPGRGTYGALVLPALGAVVTAIVWVGLVWLGWTFDGTWIWVVSLAAGAAAALVTALVTPKRRTKADARLLAELSGSKA
jgi:hypothetical protein